MEPLPTPLATAPPTTATTTTAPPPQTPLINYPDSVNSSPRSRITNSWDDAPPPLPQPPKLRLMCSYGGHIVPRPHDKSLCYIGGETHIVVIERHTTLTDLHDRFSKALLNNQPFTLKYQLPTEDLDSLISVTTDEDLENMIEEYDRLSNSSSLKPGRLRLFLFLKSSNIEHLLVETASTKSDDWFLNALNGKDANMSAAAARDCGLPESSSVNSLLGFDDDFVSTEANNAMKDAESQLELSKKSGNENGNAVNHDAHTVPDSPILETNSSFGSASSFPNLPSLPRIRVHVEENQKVGRLGTEEQFQQSVAGVGGNVNLPQKQEPGSFVVAGAVVPGVPVVTGGEYANWVLSDDDRSDHGGYRKPQQGQQQAQVQLKPQLQQFQQKQAGAVDLASPDSVSSEGSVSNPLFRQRQTTFQEPVMQIQSGNYGVSANSVDMRTGDQNHNRVHMHPQVHESGYVASSQFDQNHPQLRQLQHFVHPGTQYMPAGALPPSSYYHVYPSQQPQQHHPVLEQHYPFYFVPTRPSPGYNLPMQQMNYNESVPASAVTHPQTSPAAVAASLVHNQARNAPASESEMAGGVYTTATQQLVQDPSSQHQAQYVGFTQIQHPSQSMLPHPPANSNYGYEFAEPARAQIYYTQPLPPDLAAQYQSMASAPAGVSREASSQLPTENKASS